MTRLIATDLDGTLLRGDQRISARTARLVRRITAEGGHVALVTGRPLRWLDPVYEQLGARPPTVCANGAVVYDPTTNAILRTDPLTPQVLAVVCERLRGQIPDICFAVEIADGRELRYESTYPVWQAATDKPALMIGSIGELCSLPAVKLLVRSVQGTTDNGGTGRFVDRVADCLAGIAEVTHSSDSGLVEISAAGITKAAGLAWLCERLGVSAREVVAFGDMPNDLPMLAWAGHSVAVANAHPAVRAAADDVTSSNEEDGVAVYLERLLGQGHAEPPAPS